ncbi:MAG: hypothetical protein KAT68_08795 [Bacteroidales bacterium]|nr:hypothetical protein [Bacteroidales bacterium]
MKKAAIILVRLDSERFPNKALHNIKNKPLIEWCIDGLYPNNDFDIILATTDRVVDNPIEEFAKKKNIKCFRGDFNDTAKRIIDAATFYEINVFARVNGDSPFTNRDLLEKGFEAINNEGVDFVTNLIPRNFPYGISVEVFKTNVFKESYKFFTDFEKEHATTYFYRNISKFNPYLIKYSKGNDHNIRLVIDTPEDKANIEALLNKLAKPFNQYTLEEIINIYKNL